MGTRIRTLTSIGVIKQSGYGTPTHTSTGVTLYTDLNTGIEWENIDGTNWYSETIDRISGDTYNYNLITGLTNMFDITKTDNAAARFDTTAGEFVQDSKLIIGDDGYLSLDRTIYTDPSVTNTLLNFTQTKTSGTGSIRGLNIESLLTSSDAVSSQYNIRNYANYSGTTTLTYLYTNLNYAQNIGDGYAQNITGVYGRASNIGNGRVDKLASIVSSTINSSNDVLNNDMYSFATTSVNSGFADQYYGLQIYQTNVGTVRENIGVQIDLVGAGTTTEKMIGVDIGREHGWEGTALKSYGIYIGNTIGKGTLEKYAIFSESLEDSVFSGNIKTLSDMTILGKIKTTGITGVEYDQDYSTGYTNRSLVDKQFVINSISSGDTYLLEQINSGITVDVSNKSIYSKSLNAINQSKSILLGYNTGSGSTGTDSSIFLGEYSGYNNSASVECVFIGKNSGKNNSNMSHCVFIGSDAGTTSNGYNSNYIGYFAGSGATYSSNNNFFGNYAGVGAYSSNQSNIFGNYAGYNAYNTPSSNLIGNNAGYIAYDSQNVNFIGNYAGYKASSSSNTIFFGNYAGYNVTAVTYSNYIGDQAGSGAYSSNNMNMIGTNAGVNSYNTSYSNFIGNGAGSNASGISYSNIIGQVAGVNSYNTSYSNLIGNGAGNGARNISYSTILGVDNGTNAHYTSYSVFIGRATGSYSTGVSYSNFIGTNAGEYTYLSHSNIIGYYAGSNAHNSSYSNIIGYQAGYNAYNSKNSIFIGYRSGYQDSVNNLTNSGYSILIGPYTNTGGYSNSIAIGSGATNTATNQFLVSNQITQLNLRGLNYTLPSGQTYGTLSNDGTGTLSWVNISSNFAFFSVGNEAELINAATTINSNPLYDAGTIIFKNSFSLTQNVTLDLESITIDLNGYSLIHEDFILSIKGTSFEIKNGVLTRKSGYDWDDLISGNTTFLYILGNAIDITGSCTVAITSARFTSVKFSNFVGYSEDGVTNIKFANSNKAKYMYLEKCKISSLTGVADINTILNSPLIIEVQDSTYTELHVKQHDSPYNYLGNISKSIQLTIDAGSVKTWFSTDGTINLKNTNVQFEPTGEPTSGNIGIMSNGAGSFINKRTELLTTNFSASTMLLESNGLLYKYPANQLSSTLSSSYIEYAWNNISNPNLTSKGVVFKGGFFTTELVFRSMSGTTDVINIFSGITEGYVDFDEVINILLTTPVSPAFGGNTYTISQFVNRSSPLTVADSNFGQNIGDGYRYSPTTDFGGTYQISTSSLCKISNGLTLTVNHDVTNNPNCLVSVTLKGTIRGISY